MSIPAIKNLLLSSLLFFASSSLVTATENDKAVFYIDDTKISEKTFIHFYQSKRYPQPENTEEQGIQNFQAAQELINLYLLSKEAENHKLDQTGEVKTELELARKHILMKAMLEKYSRDFLVTNEDMENAYSRMQQNAIDRTEYKIRNIVLENENQAKNIIDQLDNGSDFNELEATYSKEKFTANNETEWILSSMLAPEMIPAIRSLEPGRYTTQPVKTKFGWHVILLKDKKVPELPPLEQIRPKLGSLIKQEMLSEKIKQLRSKVTITTSSHQK